MTVSTISAEREQAEDIFDLDVKELGDNQPVAAACNTQTTCTTSVFCCCCSS